MSISHTAAFNSFHGNGCGRPWHGVVVGVSGVGVGIVRLVLSSALVILDVAMALLSWWSVFCGHKRRNLPYSITAK